MFIEAVAELPYMVAPASHQLLLATHTNACFQTGQQPKKPAAVTSPTTDGPDTAVGPPTPLTAAEATYERRLEATVRAEVSSPTAKGSEKQSRSPSWGGGAARHGGDGKARNTDANKHETPGQEDATEKYTPGVKRATMRTAGEADLEASGSTTDCPSSGDVSADGGFGVMGKVDREETDDRSGLAGKDKSAIPGCGVVVAEGADEQESPGGVGGSDIGEQGASEEAADGPREEVERNEDQRDTEGGKKYGGGGEGDAGGEDEEEDDDEEDAEEDEQEESVKTDEEHRQELEAAIDPLKVLLVRETLAADSSRGAVG